MRHRPNTIRRSLPGLVLTVAALTVAGCGGSKAPSVAGLTTPATPARATTSAAAAKASPGSRSSRPTRALESKTGAAAAGSSPPTQAGLQAAGLAYARCMRSNGVPSFPDPSPGGGFEIPTGAGFDPSSPLYQAAQAKCRKLMPGGGFPAPGTTTHPSPQWLAQMVKIAQCMRRHGISAFPEPSTTVPPLPGKGGGVISDIMGVMLAFPSTIDMQSPLFIQAAHACGFPLHNH